MDARTLSTRVHELKTLILSYHPVIVIETVEEERVRKLLQSVATNLEMRFFEWTLTRGLTRSEDNKSLTKTDFPLQMLEHVESLTVDAVYVLKDFSQHLSEPSVARKMREVAQRLLGRRSAMVVVGERVKLPDEIEHKSIHYTLRLPGPDEIKGVIRNVIASLRGKHPVAVELSGSDFQELLRDLSGMTLNQARQIVAYCILEDGKLSGSDLKNVVERKAQGIREGGLLEYFPGEDNRYELGGFDRLKEWLERARTGFSKEAQKFNLNPPKGILIVGVQGCGKSLAAKTIAREWRLPLLKLDAGRLFDKYIGESEKNFRTAISLAESMAPAVLWIDEIEKGMAPSGGIESDGGLSRHLFGSFLTWLQEKKDEVFVVATANDLSMLPPELLRKGRFDEIFFVDLPNAQERESIFKIHLELRNQDGRSLDLSRLVKATDGFSGAEIEQVVIASLYTALHRKATPGTELILESVRETVPLSVSRREDIDELRSMAEGRFVPVK